MDKPFRVTHSGDHVSRSVRTCCVGDRSDRSVCVSGTVLSLPCTQSSGPTRYWRIYVVKDYERCAKLRTTRANWLLAATLTLLFAATVVVPLSATPARADTQGPWTYVVTGNEAAIISYDGPGGHVDVPLELGGVPVTALSPHAGTFAGNTTVTSITLPDGLTQIGNNDFRHTSNLRYVNIPSSVTGIGPRAFEGSGIETITLPDGLTSIGNSAFSDTPNLMVGVVMPEGVTAIEPNTFHGSAITSVTFHDAVTGIGDNAFRDTSNLASHVDIPPSVTTVGSMAFYGSALTSTTLPDGLTSIGSLTFASTPNLSEVNFPSTLTQIGESAFRNTPNLEVDVVIPEGVTTIEPNTFYASGITSVTFHDGLIAIGEGSFGYTSNLASHVDIPASVTSIEPRTFQSSAITSITLPDGLTTIGDSAFDTARDLTDVNFPPTLIQIGTRALRNTSSLRIDVVIPEQVTAIQRQAFQGAYIKSVVLPEGLVAIGDGAFEMPPNHTGTYLTEISIPSTVTSIGDRAFLGNRFEQLDLPDGLEVIGDSAFSSNRLRWVDIPSSITDAGVESGWLGQWQPGRTLAGWFTAPQPSTSVPGEFAGQPVDFDGIPGVGGRIYTHWSPLEITLHGNGDGSNVGGLPTVATYGERVSFGTPTRENYRFLGWSVAESGQPVEELISATEEFVMTGDVELYAQWVDATHSIDLYANAGGDHVDMSGLPAAGTYGQRVSFGAPTREHYEFLGWAPVASPGPDVELFAATDEHVITGDVELYAQWLPINYGVVFDTGGGSGSPGAQVRFRGEQVDQPGRVTRPLHAFVGWFVGDHEWDFDQDVVEHDTELTAVWAPRVVEHASLMSPGQTFSITGFGFEPDDEVAFSLGVEGPVIGSVDADTYGAVSVDAQIPEYVAAGQHVIVADATVTGVSTTQVEIAEVHAGPGDSAPPAAQRPDMEPAPSESTVAGPSVVHVVDEVPTEGELARTGAPTVWASTAWSACGLFLLGASYVIWSFKRESRSLPGAR